MFRGQKGIYVLLRSPVAESLCEIVSRFQYDLIYNMYIPCGLFSGAAKLHAIYRGRYINKYEIAAFVGLVNTFSWHFARASSHWEPHLRTFSTLSLNYICIGRENMRWEKCHVIRFGYLDKVQWKKLRQLFRVSESNKFLGCVRNMHLQW